MGYCIEIGKETNYKFLFPATAEIILELSVTFPDSREV